MWCSARFHTSPTTIFTVCKWPKKASNLLDPIMFADVNNLFLTHKDINYLFETANLQLKRIDQWLTSNKLSLNISKTKYWVFYKSKNQIILRSNKIERSKCSKCVGVLLDENLCWKEHIKYIESKIATNIGLLYKAKLYIEKYLLLSLYHSYIHSYINYGNIP